MRGAKRGHQAQDVVTVPTKKIGVDAVTRYVLKDAILLCGTAAIETSPIPVDEETTDKLRGHCRKNWNQSGHPKV